MRHDRFRGFAAMCLVAVLSQAAAALGCGSSDGGAGGISSGSDVAALSDEELRAFCAEFVSTVCPNNTALPLCQSDCSDVCERDRSPAVMRIECPTPITVGDVRACADAFAARQPDVDEICAAGMGACVLDIGDALCQ